MPQNADKVLDHFELFREPEYQELFKNKREQFENPCGSDEIEKIKEWTQTPEYKDLNFSREALTVNPAKACQPLGAVFAAVGFDGTLPFVHGSQGCVAYYRSHFSRHFKEPSSCVSSSMTEDAAVFGGLANMVGGLANSYNLYKPKMVHVSTTCMAEVIGDDLNAFIKTAKEKGSIPEDFDAPFAHTPAFVGSHLNGYDATVHSILKHFWEGAERTEGEAVNVVLGFDGNIVGNAREVKRMLDCMGVAHTLLSDSSDVWDTPTDGTFRMYDGGTTIEETQAALNAKATVSFQEYSTAKTLAYAKEKGQEAVALNQPVGVSGTDRFLMEVARLTGREIPEALTRERGRLVDAMADSMSYLHGKRFALYGDPDLCLGLAEFLLEMGAEPTHVLATNGTKKWEKKVQALFDAYPQGAACKVYPGRDLWHMRSLLFTEPVDFLIGNTYGKYLERDTGTPLIRLGFPIFDRHHHHRQPITGYAGGLNVLTKILDKIFDEADRATIEPAKTDYSYDIIR